MNKKQSGSAHLIIIIALSVALLGAVGYIFWQNYNQANTEEVVDTKTSTSKTLIIDEWNVKGVYNSEETLNYSAILDEHTFGDGSAIFLSSAETSSLGGCGDEGSVGWIQRYAADDDYLLGTTTGPVVRAADFYNSDDNEDHYMKKVGDYYYTKRYWIDRCMDGSEAAVEKVTVNTSEIFHSLKAI